MTNIFFSIAKSADKQDALFRSTNIAIAVKPNGNSVAKIK